MEPDRSFLKTADRLWTYGDTLGEVEGRMVSGPLVIRPELAPESVFEILAGLSGGGAMLLGPGDDVRADTPDDAALVVFTSGTSGLPKGVRLTTGNLDAACEASMIHLGHDESDTWLLAMPLSHVGGVSILVRSVYAGGSVRLLPEFDPAIFARALHEDVTMVSVVPTMLRRILDHDPGPYSGLRAVLVGGGPIPDGLLERALEGGLPVLPTYGMTETFGQAATLRPGSRLMRRAHPLPGVEVRVESDGRIALKGAQLSPGYLGKPDRSDPWLVTNDLGELDEEGALRVLGRADTIIITGGENVDPARVESEIEALPGVDEVLVTGVPDAVWGQLLVALFAGNAGEAAIRTALASHLPRHMVPTRWLPVPAIPRTPLGKPDRVAARVMAVEVE